MAGQGGERSGAERKEVERLRILSIALHCSLARSLALSLAVSLAPLDDTFMDLRRSERRDPPVTPCATTATVRMAIGVRYNKRR